MLDYAAVVTAGAADIVGISGMIRLRERMAGWFEHIKTLDEA